MGSGKKKNKNKNKVHPQKDQSPDTTPGANSSVSARNLRKQDLGAVIFGCRSHTVQECLSNLLFGLPATHFPYVKKIEPGLPIFLFNYNDRMLHGIYEAAGHGMMNINPYAWTSNDGDVTGYPAQVKVRVRKPCKSLKEEQIKCILHQNYFDPKNKRRFWHELDHTQTGHLLSLFDSQSLLYSSPPLKPPKHKPHDRPVLTHNARNENKYSKAPCNWASLFKESFNSKEKKEDEHLVSESNWDEENRVCLSKPSRGSDPSGVIDHWEEERQLSDVGHCWEEGVPWEAETRESSIKPFWGEEVGPSGSSPCWEEAQPTPITTKWDEELQIAETQSSKGTNEYEEHIYYKSLNGEGSTQKMQRGDVFVPLAVPYVKDVSCPAALSTTEKKDSDSEEHTDDAFYPCATHFEVEGFRLGLSTSKKKYSILEEDMKASRSTSEKYEDALISSSDIRPIVDKMRQELKEAKVYSVDQHRRAVALDRELAESGILLQHLRHRVMLLESHLQDSSKAGTRRCNNSCNNKQFIESNDEHLEGSNELLYIMGGYDGESWLQTMDCYYPSSDMLKPLKPMSSVRSHTSAALVNGLIYIYGGWNCNGKSRVWYDTGITFVLFLNPEICFHVLQGGHTSVEVECYNPWSNKWISCPPLSQKKGCLAGASVNNKIYAIGGGNGKDCFNEVEMFDPGLERWIPMQSMLQKRFASAAVELDSIIYVAGGYNGTNYLECAERFDPREGYWSKLPSMNVNRGSHALTVLKGKLYALGGYDGNKYVPSVEVFDPCMGSWLEGEKMKQPRGSFAAPVIGGTIFTIGGHAEGNKIVDSVETYRIGYGWSVTKLKGIGKRCFFSSVRY